MAHVELDGSSAEFLEGLRRKSVELWLDGDKIHFRSPVGALGPTDIEELKRRRPDILAFLKSLRTDSAVGTTSNAAVQSAPVSFSQLAQWTREELGKRPGVRSICTATRLSGRLDRAALRTSIEEIVNLHQALRTRVTFREGMPMQEIDLTPAPNLLTEVAVPPGEPDSQDVIHRAIRDLVLEPVDVAVGPLFAARLLKQRDDEHVLITAMEHIISDNVSNGLLIRDILSAYAAIVSGRNVSRHHDIIQFADYARTQRQNHDAWVRLHESYWKQRMENCSRTRFPKTSRPDTDSLEGWGTARISMSRPLDVQLREWCRARGTTVPMAVFTAYIALVMRWCNLSETIVQFQGDGRAVHGAENAIGSFACSLYLRVNLQTDDDFLDLLRQVTDQFCDAYEHQDHAYWAAQNPPPGWTRNAVFNWMPARPALPNDELTGLRTRPVPFQNPWLETLHWDNEPTTAFFESPAATVGSVHYARSEHSDDEMQAFACALLSFVEQLVTRPTSRVGDLPLRGRHLAA